MKPTTSSVTEVTKPALACVTSTPALLAAATKPQLRAITAALEAMDRAATQGKDAIDQDLELHSAIAGAIGNAQFPRFLQFIGRHLIPRRIVSGMPQSMGGREAYLKLLQEEHRAIVEAIQNRDPKAAREAMRRHLTRSVERYRKLAADQPAAA